MSWRCCRCSLFILRTSSAVTYRSSSSNAPSDSQSISQSIDQHVLSINPFIHTCIVTLVPHMLIVLLKYYHGCCAVLWTITTYVDCIVELLRLMLCCWTITIGTSVFWPVAAPVVLLNTCQMRCNVLLNLFHKCYHSCCIVLLSYYHRCGIVELLPFIFWYDCFYSIFWTNDPFANKPHFMVDYHRPRCPNKIFDFCV